MRPKIFFAAIMLAACGGGEIDETPLAPVSTPPPVTPPQTPPPPLSSEACNGLDDDADGQVDEGCACKPGESQACYTGAATQKGVGQCLAGTQKCQPSQSEFSTWGSCEGAILPGTEDCADGIDNDCNGAVDDGPGCACKPGETRTCYTGAAGTRAKGQCKDGTQTCDATGTKWDEACAGEVLPVAEICHDGIDNDCDGEVDEGCVVTVNVDIDGDCVWTSCPPSAPHPVGCNITMAGGDCRGCVANASGSSKVYFQEGNQCGAGHVSGQLYCSSVPANGLDAGNCSINKTYKYHESTPSGCPELGDGSGDGCN
jgi:hypothetical protein